MVGMVIGVIALIVFVIKMMTINDLLNVRGYWSSDEQCAIAAELERLREAFTDVLDGNAAWYDIQANTGLSEERCKEIEELRWEIMCQR